MRQIRLTESQLNRVILTSAMRLIREATSDYGMRQPREGSLAKRSRVDGSAIWYFGDEEENADARGIFHSRYGGYRRPDVAFCNDLIAIDHDGVDAAQGMRDIDSRLRQPSLDNDDELGYGC